MFDERLQLLYHLQASLCVCLTCWRFTKWSVKQLQSYMSFPSHWHWKCLSLLSHIYYGRFLFLSFLFFIKITLLGLWRTSYVIHVSYADKHERNLCLVGNYQRSLSSYLIEIADDLFVHFLYRSATCWCCSILKRIKIESNLIWLLLPWRRKCVKGNTVHKEHAVFQIPNWFKVWKFNWLEMIFPPHRARSRFCCWWYQTPSFMCIWI